MSAPVYLGIDLGTQSVRVIAVTHDGLIEASATERLGETAAWTPPRAGPRFMVASDVSASALSCNNSNHTLRLRASRSTQLRARSLLWTHSGVR